MKKIFPAITCMLCLFAATGASAFAEITVGRPPSFAPGPNYVNPYPSYYDPHHIHMSDKYWEEEWYQVEGERVQHERIVFLVQHGYEKPSDEKR